MDDTGSFDQFDETISDTESDEEYNDGPYVTRLNSLSLSLERGDSLNETENRIYRRLSSNSSIRMRSEVSLRSMSMTSVSSSAFKGVEEELLSDGDVADGDVFESTRMESGGQQTGDEASDEASPRSSTSKTSQVARTVTPASVIDHTELLQHGPSSTGTGQPEEIWRNKVIDSFLTRLAAQTKNISDEELERDYKFVGTTNYSFDGYDGKYNDLSFNSFVKIVKTTGSGRVKYSGF